MALRCLRLNEGQLFSLNLCLRICFYKYFDYKLLVKQAKFTAYYPVMWAVGYIKTKGK